MKTSLIITALLSILLFACKPGVKDNENDALPIKNQKQTRENVESLVGAKDSILRNEELLPTQKESNKDFKTYNNGLSIKWFEHGNGAPLKDGHVYKIDYEVLLDNGAVVDGSKIINRKWVHFLLGFEIQTKGWDFALKKMRIGDFAEVKIPSELARGKEGIEGLIPPNANNTLRVKILGEVTPDRIVDGTKVWILAHMPKFDDVKATKDDIITYDYVIGTPSNPRYSNSKYNSGPYKFEFSDKGIVPGLKKALLGVRKGDRLWIVVPPNQAYGKKGLLDVIKPNEAVLYDLFILSVKKPEN